MVCYLDSKFLNLINSKDDFALLDCKDARGHKILGFQVLILYLEKPTQVIIIVANTIFGALSEERKVDWCEPTNRVSSLKVVFFNTF